ncbi:hypothetical protein ACS0TY_031454 [Phlomoides rotata]
MACNGTHYLVTSRSTPDQILTMQHERWMARHGRYYESKDEKEMRFRIFKENTDYVERFNREGSHMYKLEVNAFADLTKEEFLAKYATGFRPTFHKPSQSYFKYENVTDVPNNLDWRERNVVTPISNQGQCGTCWAFSAVAAIEGVVAVKSGNLTSLSEQHIIDCNGGHEGCGGGRVEHAFDFVKQNGALASDDNYPYQAQQGTCSNDKPSSSM